MFVGGRGGKYATVTGFEWTNGELDLGAASWKGAKG